MGMLQVQAQAYWASLQCIWGHVFVMTLQLHVMVYSRVPAMHQQQQQQQQATLQQNCCFSAQAAS
jgi:hypothetical protein